MKSTEYYQTSVMTRRPYLKPEWIEFVVANRIRKEIQENGRIRFWAFIPYGFNTPPLCGEKFLRGCDL